MPSRPTQLADVRIPDNVDAFGRLIADGTRNFLDLPSHYSLSPERYRVKEQGSRVKVGNSTQVTDEPGEFHLTSAASQQTRLYTAERPRYVVGYESLASMEAQVIDSLESGDTFTVGITDDAASPNRAYFEFNGTTSNRIVLESNGTEVASKTIDEKGNRDIENPSRLAIQYNWYRVGRFKFVWTYTDDSKRAGEKQINQTLGELVTDTTPSNDEANYHLFWDLDVGAGNTTKTVAAGSCGYSTLGQVTPTTRAKALRFTNLSYGGSGDYQAVLALRVDPNRQNVFTELIESEIVFNNGDGEMLVISVPPGDTNADFNDPDNNGTNPGPKAPPQHSTANSVIQYTKDVTTFPNAAGSLVTTASDPGGFQITFSSSDAPQAGGSAGRSQSNLIRKRPLHGDNVAIVLAKRDTATSTTVAVTIETEQDW